MLIFGPTIPDTHSYERFLNKRNSIHFQFPNSKSNVCAAGICICMWLSRVELNQSALTASTYAVDGRAERSGEIVFGWC